MRRALPVLVAIETLVIAVLLTIVLLTESQGAELTGVPEAGGKPASSLPLRARSRDQPDSVRQPKREAPTSDWPRVAALSGNGLLYGRVTDNNKHGLDASVLLYDPRGNLISRDCRSDGTFVIRGLVPGRYDFRCWNPGWITVDRSIEIPPSGRRLDLVLENKPRMRVRVLTSDGKPLLPLLIEAGLTRPGPSAVATMRSPGSLLPLSTSRVLSRAGLAEWDTKGIDKAARERGVIGTLEFDAEPPPVFFVNLALRSGVVTTERVEGTPSELTLHASLADVRAVVATASVVIQDPAGQPIPRAAVTITDRQSSAAPAYTDTAGSAVVEDLSPGLLVFGIDMRGYERYRRYVRIRPGRDNNLGVVRLERGIKAKLLVADGAGNPVAGAQVSWRKLETLTPPQPLDVGIGSSSNAEGELTLWGVGAGVYLVEAVHYQRKLRAAALIELREDSQQVPRLVLLPTESVRFVTEFPPDEVHLLTVKERATGLVWLAFRKGSRFPRTKRLPRGDYVIEVHDDNARLLRTIPFAVTGDQPVVHVGR